MLGYGTKLRNNVKIGDKTKKQKNGLMARRSLRPRLFFSSLHTSDSITGTQEKSNSEETLCGGLHNGRIKVETRIPLLNRSNL